MRSGTKTAIGREDVFQVKSCGLRQRVIGIYLGEHALDLLNCRQAEVPDQETHVIPVSVVAIGEDLHRQQVFGRGNHHP
jgi:hypothetical protein